MLEHWFREKEADAPALEEKRDALAWYAKGAGGADPFSSHVLQAPIGKLDQGLFLLAHYRIETAISIAWALGLAEVIPPIEERASLELLDRLLPLRGMPQIRDAKLRDRAQLELALGEWRARTVEASLRRSEGSDANVQFSRAFERARGLAYVCGAAAWLDDVEIAV